MLHWNDKAGHRIHSDLKEMHFIYFNSQKHELCLVTSIMCVALVQWRWKWPIWKMHGCFACVLVFGLPVQLVPSPKKPGLQWHSKWVLVLLQKASSWQLSRFKLHSSKSEKKVKIIWSNNKYICLERTPYPHKIVWKEKDIILIGKDISLANLITVLNWPSQRYLHIHTHPLVFGTYFFQYEACVIYNKNSLIFTSRIIPLVMFVVWRGYSHPPGPQVADRGIAPGYRGSCE